MEKENDHNNQILALNNDKNSGVTVEIIEDTTQSQESPNGKIKEEKSESTEIISDSLSETSEEDNIESNNEENNTTAEEPILSETESKFKEIPNITKPHHIKHFFITVGVFLGIFLILICTIFGVFTVYNLKNNSVISKGVYINNIDVSGLTKDEAKSRIEEFYTDKLSNDISLTHNDYVAYIKTSEIELNYDIDSAVDYAYKVGKTSNIFVDNFHIFSAMINGVNITPTYTYNEELLTNMLSNFSAELPDRVVESSYYIDGNNLIITKGTKGYSIDIEKTSKLIIEKFENLNYINEPIEIQASEVSPKEIDLEQIYNEVHTDAQDAYYTTDPFVVYPSSNGVDFKISMDEAKELLANSESECTIPLKVLYPSVTTNMIGNEAFPDLLGSFSTKYAASNSDRTTNLKLAAAKVNGTVLIPGETFSYNSVVGERTIAAGYKEAAVYENGAVTQGIGGGICQISSTLYNAVLFANLGIVELHNHQFVPSYVTAGRDATVVYGVKDFKFKNTRKYAIKINCTVSGGVASFNIWGHKEDTEYDVSVYANVTSRTSEYIKASTYRTLKLNGQTISTEHIANSTYKVH